MMAELNIKPNALFTADNLHVLNGLNSDCVDLIYLDPPFNSKRLYAAPIGSKAAGAVFKDTWTWQDVDGQCLDRLIDDYPYLARYIGTIGTLHSPGMMSYVLYMAQRLIELHRVLKPTGSLYLHVDPTASHYLKVVLDRIFGRANFRNEIVWSYNRFSRRGNAFPSMHDIVLAYGKTRDAKFTPIEAPSRTPDRYRRGYQTVVDRGVKTLLVYDAERAAAKIKEAESNGVRIKHTKARVPVMGDCWLDIPILNSQARERTGYPTQKPLALLNRIIEASSNEGDVVLDPFCGCATTLVAAENLNRKWIGIDIEAKAGELVVDRLSDGKFVFNDFTHHKGGRLTQRTDLVKVRETKSVKATLYDAQDGKCEGCGTELDAHHLEIDHIVPRSRGGGDFMENYQLLCGHCNRTKGNRPMDYLRARIAQREAALNQVSFGV